MTRPVGRSALAPACGGGRFGAASGVGRAAPVLALLPPPVFAVGLLAAQSAQRVPDPWTWSLSALASLGATHRWIMTLTLALVGGIYVALAAGLRRLPAPPRLVLGVGGAMLLVAGLVPQPAGGSSPVHMAAGTVGWTAFVAWPVVLACSPRADARLRRVSVLASVVLLVLAAWFALELVTGGPTYGVSERVVALAACTWPIVPALSAPGRSRPSTARRAPEPVTRHPAR